MRSAFGALRTAKSRWRFPIASRVNNLAVLATGEDSRTLLEQQDELTRLAMAAIVQDLNAERQAYQGALNDLKSAIEYVGDAAKKVSDIAKAIKLIAKAITSVGKLVAG